MPTIMNPKMVSKVLLFDSIILWLNFAFKRNGWKRISKPCRTPALSSVNTYFFLSCLVF